MCFDKVEAHQPKKRHVIKRPDGSTQQELAVCQDCWAGLHSGYSVDEVRRIRGIEGQVPVPLKDLRYEAKDQYEPEVIQ